MLEAARKRSMTYIVEKQGKLVEEKPPPPQAKLVTDVLPASVNPLEQDFDDDTGE